MSVRETQVPDQTASLPVETRHRLIGIQAGRGAAAMLVAVYHAARMLDLPQYLGHVPLWDVFRWGHAGIDFFFVLSGFIISYAHAADLGRPARLRRYAWRRFTRIYPIYWVVTAAAIVIALFAPDRASRLQPGHVLASLLLLPHGQWPLVGVAWTLEHEMLFYVTFGVALWWPSLGVALGAAALGLIAATPFVPMPGLLAFLADPYHIEFMLSIAVAVLLRKGTVPLPRTLAALGAAAFLATGSAEYAGFVGVNGLAGRLLYGPASAMLLLGLAAAEQRGLLRFGRGAALLGAASYSIYLVSTTAIGLLAKAAARLGVMAAVPDWLVLAAVAALTLLAGIATYWIAERPLMACLRRLGARPQQPLLCRLPAG